MKKGLRTAHLPTDQVRKWAKSVEPLRRYDSLSASFLSFNNIFLYFRRRIFRSKNARISKNVPVISKIRNEDKDFFETRMRRTICVRDENILFCISVKFHSYFCHFVCVCINCSLKSLFLKARSLLTLITQFKQVKFSNISITNWNSSKSSSRKMYKKEHQYVLKTKICISKWNSYR